MNAAPLASPFLGLRPFQSGDAELFFGRDQEIDELLKRLSSERFLAVTGASGSGKSSLVAAGVIPRLLGGGLRKLGGNWNVVQCRPGVDPHAAMAAALAKNGRLTAAELEAGVALPAVFEAVLRQSSRGLIDALRRQVGDASQHLVVIDQFEELFRYRQASLEHGAAEDDAAAFVKLLLTAASSKESQTYVIVTLRTDYLGQCELFHGLPEAMSRGHYLVPRLTREQLESTLSEPLQLFGATMDEALVQQVLLDVGDRPHLLPQLQHALLRTWHHWEKRATTEPLSIRDYRAVGGVHGALDAHLDELWEPLEDSYKQVAETMFKRLSALDGSREVRHPSSIEELCQVARASEAAVVNLVTLFRAPGATFLTPLAPPVGEPSNLHHDTLIDLTHESVISCWKKLKAWVHEEREAGAVYRRVVEAALEHQAGNGGLLQEPLLSAREAWRKALNPTEAWAQRYYAAEWKAENSQIFALTEQFLASSRAFEDSSRRRNRIFKGIAALITGGVVTLAILFGLSQAKIANLKKGIDEATAMSEQKRLMFERQRVEQEGKLDADRREFERKRAEQNAKLHSIVSEQAKANEERVRLEQANQDLERRNRESEESTRRELAAQAAKMHASEQALLEAQTKLSAIQARITAVQRGLPIGPN